MPKKKKNEIFGGSGSRSEIAGLKAELMSNDRKRVTDGVKKIIAMQTVGSDVSSLFTDVTHLFHHATLELKKLVYMFIINFSQHNPTKTMEAVPTIQRDCRDKHPFMRALALRTLSGIRTERMTEIISPHLLEGLRDRDPYVRKTAAVCVTKIFNYKPDFAEKEGLIEKLRGLVSDPNPMVVANAVAGLSEITQTKAEDVFDISPAVMAKLLAALNECTEWGQVFILDSLSSYRPSAAEAEGVIERVIPFVQHVNSAVQMSAIRVCVNLLGVIENEDLERSVLKTKLPPPLITLLSESQPEMQYVALRNINLIVQRWPEVLAREVKHFFCKYNDPSYIKMEKLEILINLATEETVEEVLLELREYAKEVDVHFVRKAVLAIGRCAIKISSAAEACVKVLVELIQTKVNYVVQEAISVIRDIFRKYPNKYESVIATLCENLDSLDEPDAKAAMIWIIGEYSDRIENVPALLEDFVETFQDDQPAVQLSLLTAVVKFFLRRPDEAKEMVTKVLNLATDHADNPDLRDRGYVYWRLLSTDPEAAQRVVLANKPVISEESFAYEDVLLDVLMANLSTLSAVYHKPPEQFVRGGQTLVFGDDSKDSDSSSDSDSDDSGDDDDSDSDASDAASDTMTPKDAVPDAAPAAAAATPVVDFLTGFGDMSVSTKEEKADELASAPIVLKPDNPKCPGLQLRQLMARRSNQMWMDILVTNNTSKPLQNFAVKFNKNFFGLRPVGQFRIPGGVAVGSSGKGSLLLNFGGPIDSNQPAESIQVAIKTDAGVAFFLANVDATAMTQEDGKLGQREFIGKWKDLGDAEEKLDLGHNNDVDAVKAQMEKHRVFLVAKRPVKGKGTCLYSSAKINNEEVLLEVSVGTGGAIKGAGKASDLKKAKAVLQALAKVL